MCLDSIHVDRDKLTSTGISASASVSKYDKRYFKWKEMYRNVTNISFMCVELQER